MTKKERLAELIDKKREVTALRIYLDDELDKLRKDCEDIIDLKDHQLSTFALEDLVKLADKIEGKS